MPTPGCIIFLMDESGGMGAVMRDTVADGTKSQKNNAQRVATAFNSLIKQLTAGPDCDVALIGYRADAAGNVNVGSRWAGSLAGREFVTLRELSTAPLKVEARTRKVPNPGGFGVREETIDFPVWYEPALDDGAPQVAAYQACQAFLSRWLEQAGDRSPPLVFHLHAGWTSDGNPQMLAEQLVGVTTPAGQPLIVQIHLASAAQGLTALYPSSAQYVSIMAARDLFRCSSPLPDLFVTALRAAKVSASPGSHAMLYNAKIADVIQALALAKAYTQPSSVQAVPMGPQPIVPATADDVPAAITMDDLMKPKQPSGANASASSAQPPVPPQPAPPPPPMPGLYGPAPALAPPPVPTAQVQPPAPQAQSPAPQAQSSPPVMPSGHPLPGFPLAESGPAWSMGGSSFESAKHVVDAPPGAADDTAETFSVTSETERPRAWSGGHVALIVLVLDRSLEDPVSNPRTSAFTKLQDQANDLLKQIAQCREAAIDSAVIAYGLGPFGQPELRSTFEGLIAERTVVSQPELSAACLRVDEFTEQVSNGIGGLVSVTRRKPIYLELKPTLPASPVAGFGSAAQIARDWSQQNSLARVPPIVVHLTRGQGETSMIAAATNRLLPIETLAGPVLLYHVIYTETPHPSLAYPSNDQDIQDPILKQLLGATSPLVGGEQLSATGRAAVTGNSRGFVVNCKFDLLLDGLKAVLVG